MVTLHVDGVGAASERARGTWSAFAPVLSPGTHFSTATATTEEGTSLPSDPLRLTEEPLAP